MRAGFSGGLGLCNCVLQCVSVVEDVADEVFEVGCAFDCFGEPSFGGRGGGGCSRDFDVRFLFQV